MISEIESAIKGVAENTGNARIRARLKYLVICDKGFPLPCQYRMLVRRVKLPDRLLLAASQLVTPKAVKNSS
jgi:hypothetical protein